MLTPPGVRPPVGAGSLLFRYIYGQYGIGRSRLYVNAGIGNWLPIRINAPAEIVKIRLTRERSAVSGQSTVTTQSPGRAQLDPSAQARVGCRDAPRAIYPSLCARG